MQQLKIYAQKNYPKLYERRKFQNLTPLNSVILGVGGNFDSTPRVLNLLFENLKARPQILKIASSPILKNPAFGFTAQNDFYNAILKISTTLNLTQLYTLIFYLERRFGRARKREFKNAPRILDIDLIMFNDLILKQVFLTIPHKFWAQRISVCAPLSFIDF